MTTEANARTNVPPQPAQVTGVNATGISDSEIQVTWSAARDATGYVVQWATDSAFSDPGSAQVGSAGAIIERLTPETEYFVRVQATRAGAPAGPVAAAAAATTLDSRIHVLIDRAPGGSVAVQLGLAIFAGVLASTRAKGMKSPQREAAITGAISFGALILPFFGQGNNFWIIGIALLVLLSSIATIFIASRR